MARIVAVVVLAVVANCPCHAAKAENDTPAGLSRLINSAYLQIALRQEALPTPKQSRSLKYLVYSLEDAAVPILLDAMNDKSVYLRRNAMIAGYGLRKPSIAVLNARLRMDTWSDGEFEAAQITHQLYEFKDRFPNAVGKVLAAAALEPDCEPSSFLAMFQLFDKLPELTPSVVALATRKTIKDHRLAALLLAHIPPSTDAHSVARQLFKSADPDVRRYTAWSISEWDTDLDPYFDDISKQLAEEKDTRRGKCFEALGRMRKRRQEASRIIQSSLKSKWGWDDYHAAQSGIGKALGLSPFLASECLPAFINQWPTEDLTILFAMRVLKQLDPTSKRFLQKTVDQNSSEVCLEVAIEYILKLDPKLLEWGNRVVERLKKSKPFAQHKCLLALAKAPPPKGAVALVTELLKDADPLVRCDALHCLFSWNVADEHCAAMLKVEPTRTGDDAGRSYFLDKVEKFLDRPGVVEAVVALCGCSDEFSVEESLYQICRLVALHQKAVPNLPKLQVKETEEIQMYLAWLKSADQKPRGIGARDWMIRFLEGDFGVERYWAARLLLLSDPTLWPSKWELERMIAIESDDLALPVLQELLKKHPGRK